MTPAHKKFRAAQRAVEKCDAALAKARAHAEAMGDAWMAEVTRERGITQLSPAFAAAVAKAPTRAVQEEMRAANAVISNITVPPAGKDWAVRFVSSDWPSVLAHPPVAREAFVPDSKPEPEALGVHAE